MSQAAVAQVNVRLPRELKESGDEGLRALGLSPTDAVRMLWTRLSKRGDDLAEVQHFLLGDSPRAERPTQFEQSPLAKGWRVVDESIAAMEITAREPVAIEESDNDLVALALEERMCERGLM